MHFFKKIMNLAKFNFQFYVPINENKRFEKYLFYHFKLPSTEVFKLRPMSQFQPVKFFEPAYQDH